MCVTNYNCREPRERKSWRWFFEICPCAKNKQTGASTLKTFHLGSDQKPVDNLGVNVGMELRRLNKSCMVRFITSAFVFKFRQPSLLKTRNKKRVELSAPHMKPQESSVVLSNTRGNHAAGSSDVKKSLTDTQLELHQLQSSHNKVINNTKRPHFKSGYVSRRLNMGGSETQIRWFCSPFASLSLRVAADDDDDSRIQHQRHKKRDNLLAPWKQFE